MTEPVSAEHGLLQMAARCEMAEAERDRLAAERDRLAAVLVEVSDCLDADEPGLAAKIIRLRGHR
jgi:hypothetical protein